MPSIKLQNMLCCVALMATVILALVMPPNTVPNEWIVISGSITIALIAIKMAMDLKKHHSFYGLVQVILAISLLLIIGGSLATAKLGISESFVLGEQQSVAIHVGEEKPSQEIKIEKITGKQFQDTNVHFAWTFNHDTTFHDTLSQTNAFTYKNTRIQLIGADNGKAQIVVQQDCGRTFSLIGGILLLIGLSFYAIPWARPKRGGSKS